MDLKSLQGQRKANALFIGIVCLVGLAGIFLLLILINKGSAVRVSVDGVFYGEYSLCKDGEYTIEGIGGTNILRIEGGEAYVIDADCPDKICMRMHRIKYSKESIVCLPHRVIIEVIDGGEAKLDAVTG